MKVHRIEVSPSGAREVLRDPSSTATEVNLARTALALYEVLYGVCTEAHTRPAPESEVIARG